MSRMTREESRAVTQERLLAAAHDLFRREGYAATSVDRIAQAAGYSKGAVYSNFEGKEAIFLAVLEAQGQEGLDSLLGRIDRAADTSEVIELLADWADSRSRSGGWSLTILEHARTAPEGSAAMRRQEEIIRGHWRQLGERILPHLREVGSADAELLGALLHEIAYAPALTFVGKPTAGDLMRLSMAPLLRPPASVSVQASGQSAVRRGQ